MPLVAFVIFKAFFLTVKKMLKKKPVLKIFGDTSWTQVCIRRATILHIGIDSCTQPGPWMLFRQQSSDFVQPGPDMPRPDCG